MKIERLIVDRRKPTVLSANSMSPGNPIIQIRAGNKKKEEEPTKKKLIFPVKQIGKNRNSLKRDFIQRNSLTTQKQQIRRSAR